MRILVSFLAGLMAVGQASWSNSVHAAPVIQMMDGLDEFWRTFRTLDRNPDRLAGRRFELHYYGPMDEGERLRLDIDPRQAFEIRRRDHRTFVVIVRRPRLLMEQDFVREIRMRASLESQARYTSPGKGNCTLAVSFRSDVGRLLKLYRYHEVDIQWSPRQAAVQVGRGPDHVIFQRTEGHGRTPVEVHAKLYLRDGSIRVTEPAYLGYCEEDRTGSSRAGLEVFGGGAVSDDIRPSWDIGVPFEIRADDRLHIRLGPALTWQSGHSFGIVGAVGVGYRANRGVGFRVGGEAGWARLDRALNPVELNVMRAAGSFGVVWSLDSSTFSEIGFRVRMGTIGGEGFGDAGISISWLPLPL